MRIALVCPELHGHLNPMATLGEELLRRGHRVSLVGSPRARSKADSSGFELLPIGIREHESGEIQAELDALARLKGVAALRFTISSLKRGAEIFLRDATEQFRSCGIEGVVVDQVSPAGAAVADVLKLPFITVCNALALQQDPGVPPGVLTWRYRRGFLAELRNRFGNAILDHFARPITRLIDDYRVRNGVLGSKPMDPNTDGLAHIAQQPDFFDFPRRQLPSHFHYTGPWHGLQRDSEQSHFPWEILDGRPLIYASMGTLQNRLSGFFEAILEGCRSLNVQVVVSLGRKDAVWEGVVPSNAIVVPFAPQLKLLQRARLLITHAGLNTALEGLAQGVPMLCIPITNDQPGVARRVEWLGAGEVLQPKKVTAERIRKLVEKLLLEEGYRIAAGKCRERLKDNPGVKWAADIAEKSLLTGKRVER